MKTYNDFIQQIGSNMPVLPQKAYTNVRLRCVGEKYVLPTLFAIPAFVFFGIFLLLGQTAEPAIYDFFAVSDEMLFTGGGFYSLFDW